MGSTEQAGHAGDRRFASFTFGGQRFETRPDLTVLDVGSALAGITDACQDLIKVALGTTGWARFRALSRSQRMPVQEHLRIVEVLLQQLDGKSR